MVSVINIGNIYKLVGLSSEKDSDDIKSKLTNGTQFYAMDTKKAYIWNEDGAAWVEITNFTITF